MVLKNTALSKIVDMGPLLMGGLLCYRIIIISEETD